MEREKEPNYSPMEATDEHIGLDSEECFQEPLHKKEELAEVEREPLNEKKPRAVGAVEEREPLYEEKVKDIVESRPPKILESAAVDIEPLEEQEYSEVTSVADEREPFDVEEVEMNEVEIKFCSEAEREPLYMKEELILVEREPHPLHMEEGLAEVEREPLYEDKPQAAVDREPLEEPEYSEVSSVAAEREPFYVEEVEMKKYNLEAEREPLYMEKEPLLVERGPCPLHMEEGLAEVEREPLYEDKPQAAVDREPLEEPEYSEVSSVAAEREPFYVEEVEMKKYNLEAEREPLYMEEERLPVEREPCPLHMEEGLAEVEREPLYEDKPQAAVDREPLYVQKPQSIEDLVEVERESVYMEDELAIAERKPFHFEEEQLAAATIEREALYMEVKEDEDKPLYREELTYVEREPVELLASTAVEREPLYMQEVQYVEREPQLVRSAVERAPLYMETAKATDEREPVQITPLNFTDRGGKKETDVPLNDGDDGRERRDSIDSLIEPIDVEMVSPVLYQCQMNDRELEYEMPNYTEDDLNVLRHLDDGYRVRVERLPSLDESILRIPYEEFKMAESLMAEPQREYLVEPEIEMTKVEDYFEETDNTPMKKNDTFMYKECCKVKKIDKKRCGCGRKILDHSPDVIETAEYGDWITIFDTRQKESFPRKIHFDLNETIGNRATSASYVRLADDTDVRLAAEHHEKFWLKNYKPDILISFLGGCGKDFISKCTEDTLVEGISKLLRTCDSLFFTRASHTGLAKLVGRICNSHTQRWNSGYVNQCVGFMPWGRVAGRDMLDGREGEEIIEYKSEGSNLSLDPNHQEFFLVDDGTLNQFGTEVRLRSRLQQFLVNKHKIPSINLLLGGGLTSIAAMHAAVFPEIEISKGVIIPMVVLKNSGRAADVFSYVLESDLSFRKWKNRKYTKYRNINLTLATKSAALKYLDLELSSISNLKALGMVRECVEKQGNKIFICDVAKADRALYEVVQMASLEVSFFDRKSNSMSELPIHRKIRIAMELNQVKHARDLMRRGGKAIYYPMDDSMLRCNPRIVEELLDIYNFNVKIYVRDSLKHLYTSQEYKDIRGERKVMEYFMQKYPFEMNLGSSDQNDNSTPAEKLITFDIDKTLHFLTYETVSDLHEMTPGNITHCQEKINATQALLINSVLINQPSLTKVFWKYDKYNPLSNALLAYQLQCSIAKLYKGNTNIPQQLTEGIEYFKVKIVQLLTCYYETDQQMVSRVLTRKIPMWKNRSLVDVAGDFKSKFFIEQPASQIVVSKAWKGQDPDCKTSLGELERRSKEECCLPGNFFACCHLINKSIGTPQRKLFMHILMYLLSVGIFSYYLLVKDSPAHLAIKWIMFVMISSLALDEVRQTTDFGKKSFRLNAKLWKSDTWNILDVLCILLYYAGFAAGFYSHLTSICIHSVFLALWCIKFTQFLRMSSRIGPYMVMIFQMVAHMRSFLVVLLIAVIGYGVFMTALLFQSPTTNWEILFKVLFRPYFLVFGELGINSHELENSKTVFGTKKISRVSEIMVILGMAVFMLFANVLLLNLLIAAFSNIYETVQSASYQIWRFEQYELLCEFKKKPLLPFPLSIPENVCFIYRYCRECNNDQIQESKENREDVREIANFERFCMMKLWPKLSVDDEDQSYCEEEKVLSALGDLTKEINESDESNVRSALAQKEQLRKRVEAVKEGVLERLVKTEEKLSQRQDKLDQRLDNMERILLRLDKIFEHATVDFGDQ